MGMVRNDSWAKDREGREIIYKDEQRNVRGEGWGRLEMIPVSCTPAVGPV